MDVSTKAIDALAQGQWSDLEVLCAEWMDEETDNMAPQILQAMAWMFIDPPKPDAAFQAIGTCFRQKKQLQEITRWIEHVKNDEDLKANPRFNTFTSFAEGIQSNKYDALDEALERFPYSVELLTIRGLVAQGPDQQKFLRKAINIDPTARMALFSLAAYEGAAGKKREALRLLLNLVNVCPHLAEAYFMVGMACLASKQVEPAAYYFHRTLSLQPESKCGKEAAKLLKTRLKKVNSSLFEQPDYQPPEIDLNRLP